MCLLATLTHCFQTKMMSESTHKDLPKFLPISVGGGYVSRFAQKYENIPWCSQQWQQKKKRKRRKRPTVLKWHGLFTYRSTASNSVGVFGVCGRKVGVFGVSCSSAHCRRFRGMSLVCPLPAFSGYVARLPIDSVASVGVDRSSSRLPGAEAASSKSVTGERIARKQSAFSLTLRRARGTKTARSRDDIERWRVRFVVSDRSRLSGAHRRQIAAKASLAKIPKKIQA